MFGFKRYQSGGQVDEYQQLEDYVRQYKDYISNWVTQRPSVTRTYDDLLKDVTDRNIKLNKYSKEELVAELGAMFLVGILDLNPKDSNDNSQAYINGWIKYLKNNPKEILSASSKSRKAIEYILNK